MSLIITVETANGTVLDSAPISEASSVTITQRLDRIGDVSFTMPATSIRADVLYPTTGTRYLRIQAFRNGAWLTLGRYIVRNKRKDGNSRTLNPSGPDILGELDQTHVGKLKLATGSNPLAAASVLSAVMAFALPGWTVTGTPSKDVYFKFGDESVFAALTKVKDYCGDHFRGRIIAGVKTLEWKPTNTGVSPGFDAEDSGIVAVDSGDPLALVDNPNVAVIVGGLQPETDDTERITRISPRGGGNADTQLYITKAQRFGAPTTSVSGDYVDPADPNYTFHLDITDPWKSYIAYTLGEPTSYDVINDPKSFRDIGELGSNAADTVSAANALFDTALASLKQRILPQRSFRLRLTKLHMDLLPGQAIRVISNHYTDDYGWMKINDYVMVLEIKTTYSGKSGDPMVDLQVTM